MLDLTCLILLSRTVSWVSISPDRSDSSLGSTFSRGRPSPESTQAQSKPYQATKGNCTRDRTTAPLADGLKPPGLFPACAIMTVAEGRRTDGGQTADRRRMDWLWWLDLFRLSHNVCKQCQNFKPRDKVRNIPQLHRRYHHPGCQSCAGLDTILARSSVWSSYRCWCCRAALAAISGPEEKPQCHTSDCLGLARG